jgi:trimeric autotransporter adhesin
MTPLPLGSFLQTALRRPMSATASALAFLMTVCVVAILTSGVIGSRLPDLRVTEIGSFPPAVRAGDSFTLTSRTRNFGGVMAPASSTRFYLSPQPARGSDANLLEGTQSIPSLVSGTNVVASVTVAVPTETAAGSYYLVGCADDTRLVLEKNERNNCLATRTQILVVQP